MAYEDDRDAEFYIPLKFRWALPDENQWAAEAPKPWEINERWNSSHKFRRTVLAISQDRAGAIDSIARDKGISIG